MTKLSGYAREVESHDPALGQPQFDVWPTSVVPPIGPVLTI
jgi:hypothetical protein